LQIKVSSEHCLTCGRTVTNILPVSARARQLNHRLRGRKAAIISRRESEADTKLPILRSQSSPPPTDDANGLSTKPNGITGMSQSPPMGFTAVNTRQSPPAESRPDSSPDLAASAASVLQRQYRKRHNHQWHFHQGCITYNTS
jgi:hypothetical protein